MNKFFAILAIAAFLSACSSKGDFECECTETSTNLNTGETATSTSVIKTQRDVKEEDFEEGCNESHSYEDSSFTYEETCVTKEI